MMALLPPQSPIALVPARRLPGRHRRNTAGRERHARMATAATPMPASFSPLANPLFIGVAPAARRSTSPPSLGPAPTTPPTPAAPIRAPFAPAETARAEPARQGAGHEWVAVERWVRQQLGDVEHERRVAQVATALFDLTRPLHGLGLKARHVLFGGALLHDVGRCVDDVTHPRQGANLILHDPALPLTSTVRRWMAYLTLYHRDGVPAVGADGVLRRDDDRPALRVLLALLRAADALDSRSAQTPHLLLAYAPKRGRVPILRITITLRRPGAKAVRAYSRRKKFRALAGVLGCEVRVRLRRE